MVTAKQSKSRVTVLREASDFGESDGAGKIDANKDSEDTRLEGNLEFGMID